MRILLIKRGAMGDILMTTPLIRQLRQNFPQAIIDYCLAQPFLAALKDNPYIDNILPMDDKVFSNKGILKYIHFSWSMRKKYDYIFLLGKNWQLNILSLIFNGTTIGYARENISKYFLNKYVVYNDVKRYHGLYYLDLLKASGLATPDYNDISLNLAIAKDDIANVEAKLKSLDISKFIVVVNSGGNNQYESGGVRMLPPDKINQLLVRLAAAKYPVLLLGGNLDKANYSTYCAINPARIFNFAGVLNLPQSTYLISQAEHFYTTDCGAMHLGVIAGVGAKMTCFFGPTCPDHVLPPDNQFKIVWNDEDIFSPDYPLTGKFRIPKRDYFSNLNMDLY